MQKSFTLVELLISIAIVTVIAVGLIALINPWHQIAKSNDARRKQDLDTLKKAFEDYFNDHGCYPKPSEVCYDTPVPLCQPGGGSLANRNIKSQVCHICGSESTSPSFSPYSVKLPCDSEHKKKDYLYEVEANSNLKCQPLTDATLNSPSWYRIYTDFSNEQDNESKSLGCSYGSCGIPPLERITPGIIPYYSYDYGISSQNRDLEKATAGYCYNNSGRCNFCAQTIEGCMSNINCSLYKDYYTSLEGCCLIHPGGSHGCF